MLAEVLATDDDWLLIDLRGCDHPDVVGARLGAAAVRRRPAGRTCLVSHAELAISTVACFASIADACQAKLFHDEGFGTGWWPR